MLHRGLRSLKSHSLQHISAKLTRNYGIDTIEKVVGKETVDRLVNSIDDIKSIVCLFVTFLLLSYSYDTTFHCYIIVFPTERTHFVSHQSK